MAFENPQASLPSNDPYATYVNASCFEFLLIELVPMAYRMAAELATREQEWLGNKVPKEVESMTSGFGIGGIGGSVAGMDEDETREQVFFRLESLGYRVGLGLVERFSRDKPRFTDTLDAIKFLCKDLWVIVFRKQIDNLKTNHRGIYVLTDNTFKPLTKMSLERGRDGMMAQAQPFLYFPAGVIRGALAAMGINATVQAECSEIPSATFQIRSIGAKP
ncbi:trafficking protein particle complex subunit 6A [Trichodelitschia bisporula]|uniref:Trafficking protein particle complex subunit 6A n=1 Tax=Trichodelitschia bisporula TaxID=703511 RepID=A0A6G1I803_9PEZI|nr:trafficking protein particle complex subunit 6A [Trichodelitschia bisporula]